MTGVVLHIQCDSNNIKMHWKSLDANSKMEIINFEICNESQKMEWAR